VSTTMKLSVLAEASTFFNKLTDSVVGIATGYRLDGPGIKSRWRRDFPHPWRSALEPSQSPVRRVPGHSQGYSGRSVALTTNPT
jgi:hypothetical protein